MEGKINLLACQTNLRHLRVQHTPRRVDELNSADWIAGKVMSNPSERRVILNILERIEREIGWVTTWRQDDLKSWWGDSDD